MWLALDIGNSAVKGGLFDGPRLCRTFRLGHPAAEAQAVWDETLTAALGDAPVERAGVASVVPVGTARARSALRRLAGLDAEVLRPEDAALPFVLAYETPTTLGADRLAAAAAAWALHRPASGGAVVAVDAGTAVTYDVIDAGGRFLGGAIGAGPQLLGRALHQGTAQLPIAVLEPPARTIGRSTQEALQAGVMHGFVDAVRGMLARIAEELGETPLVIATGGWGAFLHERLSAIDRVDAHLALRGIRVLMALRDEIAAP